MVLQTFDEDLLVHDFIGGARPIPWQDFCFDEKEKEMTVDLYDKKKKKCGALTFKTKFIYVKVENISLLIQLPRFLCGREWLRL